MASPVNAPDPSRDIPSTRIAQHGENGDDDIYRGDPPSRPSSPSSSSTSSTSSSSSSSSGAPLGGLTALVEHAIARWARAWASSASLETASTVSTVSATTMNKSQLSRPRRRRRTSDMDARNAQSEREVAARLRAREESRLVPRVFELYVPHSVGLPFGDGVVRTSPDGMGDHTLHTASLPLLLTHLSATLRDARKVSRGRQSHHAPAPESQATSSRLLHHDWMMPEQTSASPLPTVQDLLHHHHHRAKKGKRRVGAAPPSAPAMPPSATLMRPESPSPEGAWWLDVSSPTWEDMRSIGKLLHLHPLTLEDILLQDPREKLEIFPKLGYHFIVFRAIESEKTRGLRAAAGGRISPHSIIEEGQVGEVNMYLVIFRDGVCSFHFADMDEHLDHVRNKITKLGESVVMSSDWIAHGIMDSIVDSIFPVLYDVEQEVADLETLVASDLSMQPVTFPPPQPPVPPLQSVCTGTESPATEKVSTPLSLSEKATLPVQFPPRKTLLPLVPTFPFKWLIQSVREIYSHFHVKFERAETHQRMSTIHRMARTRRIVTSLGRLLAHKSDVVAQIQKRLLPTATAGRRSAEDNEMFIYMGDIQDHVLTLQQSLAHYERVLSQSHPIYISRLRVAVAQSQSGTDRVILNLSTMSMGVVCISLIIGLCSMNVLVPRNSLVGYKYFDFGIVIAISGLVLIMYAFLVRSWWVTAKKKRKTASLRNR